MQQPIIIALPKGRILGECGALLKKAGMEPDPSIYDENQASLRFASSNKHITFIRVRSFDVITYVAQGAASAGICGEDVLLEHPTPDVYAPLDLGIGRCRMSIAEPKGLRASDDPRQWSHIRVATKYPHFTQTHFATRGVVAECIKLNGAVELAPLLNMCPRIVDLVSTGRTLEANDLVEVEVLRYISSLVIVNRGSMKTANNHLLEALKHLKEATDASS